MEYFSFTCKLCNKTAQLPLDLKGKSAKCQYCRESVLYDDETVDIRKPFFVRRNDRFFGPFTMEEVEHFQLFSDDYIGESYNGPWHLAAEVPSLSTGKASQKHLRSPQKRERFARPIIVGDLKSPLQPLFEGKEPEQETINVIITHEIEETAIQISTEATANRERAEVIAKEIIVPNLVCNFSLIFGPFFGALLHAKNWRTLEKPKAASKTWYWAFAAYGIGWLISLGLADKFANISASKRLGYLFAVFLWYFAAGRPHVKYYERLTRQLKREGRANDWVEVGIPAYAFLLFIIIGLLLGFIIIFSMWKFDL